MSADVPLLQTQRRLAPKELTVITALGTMVVVACLWLWAVFATPADARGVMAITGGLCAVLLTGAAAAIAHYVAVGRRQREQVRAAAARVARLEREIARVSEDTLPALGRQVRGGGSVTDALARVPQPPDGPLQQLLKAVAHELDGLERERAIAQTSRSATEAEIITLTRDTLPELVKQIQMERKPVTAALSEVRQPVHAPLRDLLAETARQLAEGDRRGAAVMAACAGAAARVQAQATSLLALLRDLEEQYGDQEEVFSDLLDLDHRVSQLGRLADNIALLSGGRSGRRWTRPIVMESVLRGAMGRISAYQRVRVHSTSTVAVVGYAAEGVMHALAELMDNAATFSAHGTEVHVYVDEEDAGMVITIEDSGLGMRPRERQHAAKLVSEPLDLRTLSGTRLGLAVVGRLVDKYGLTVSFRPSARGGTGVVMLIPRVLITQPRTASESPAEIERQSPPALEAATVTAAVTVPAQTTPADEEPEEQSLPRRRRGQTLAEAARSRPATAVKPAARDGREAAARFAAFRQAGGRGRPADPASGDS
ncbi:sensor histidine kinase [Nonomuraea sp. NPDC048826]|uniref:sensor histidine kinase n=1 Tax=Nonomuraea sp. NPDC048826 TaxID=3364347 RepID=UPI003716E339